MNTYRIKDGERLIMDGKELSGGDLIDLPDDLADMHKNRLELVPAKPEKEDVEQV